MKKIPLDNPRYRIPLQGGGYILNFTKWSRENEPKTPHKYKVGDTLILTTEVEVKSLHFDCDGTALYELYNLGPGFSGEQLAPPDTE